MQYIIPYNTFTFSGGLFSNGAIKHKAFRHLAFRTRSISISKNTLNIYVLPNKNFSISASIDFMQSTVSKEKKRVRSFKVKTSIKSLYFIFLESINLKLNIEWILVISFKHFYHKSILILKLFQSCENENYCE